MTTPSPKVTATREESALRDPGNLAGFPTKPLEAEEVLYRAVKFQRPKLREAWYFSSFARGENPKGRFDLTDPKGTCYLSTDIQTAVREKVGEVISPENAVPQSTVDDMEVVVVKLPRHVELAYTGDGTAANYGAIRELGAAAAKEAYVKTSKWAAAFSALGLGGVLYASRFTSIDKCTAVALFGNAGLESWAEEDRMSGKDAFTSAKMAHVILRTPFSISSSTKPVAPPPPLKGT